MESKTQSSPSSSSSDSVPPPPKTSQQQQETGTAMNVLNFTNTALAILIVYVLYKLFGTRKRNRNNDEERFRLPDPLPKHDMTLDELKQYNGTGPDKRICIAILGRVYDCTKRYDFYGPGGAYSTLAGHDASRALAKFDVMAVSDEWDDITDLDENELSAVMEWNEQFQEKYDYVGRLVRSKEEILERADDNIVDNNDDDDDNDDDDVDDEEIEVINSNENSGNEQETATTTTTNQNNNDDKDKEMIGSKKVSFIDAKQLDNDNDENKKKLSESSDDIEVINEPINVTQQQQQQTSATATTTTTTTTLIPESTTTRTTLG